MKMMDPNLMVQQQVDNLWQHFVGVICLNQTGRMQVKRVLPEFFDKWPTPEAFLKSRKSTVIKVIKSFFLENEKDRTTFIKIYILILKIKTYYSP